RLVEPRRRFSYVTTSRTVVSFVTSWETVRIFPTITAWVTAVSPARAFPMPNGSKAPTIERTARKTSTKIRAAAAGRMKARHAGALGAGDSSLGEVMD